MNPILDPSNYFFNSQSTLDDLNNTKRKIDDLLDVNERRLNSSRSHGRRYNLNHERQKLLRDQRKVNELISSLISRSNNRPQENPASRGGDSSSDSEDEILYRPLAVIAQPRYLKEESEEAKKSPEWSWLKILAIGTSALLGSYYLYRLFVQEKELKKSSTFLIEAAPKTAEVVVQTSAYGENAKFGFQPDRWFNLWTEKPTNCTDCRTSFRLSSSFSEKFKHWVSNIGCQGSFTMTKDRDRVKVTSWNNQNFWIDQKDFRDNTFSTVTNWIAKTFTL